MHNVELEEKNNLVNGYVRDVDGERQLNKIKIPEPWVGGLKQNYLCQEVAYTTFTVRRSK